MTNQFVALGKQLANGQRSLRIPIGQAKSTENIFQRLGRVHNRQNPYQYGRRVTRPQTNPASKGSNSGATNTN